MYSIEIIKKTNKIIELEKKVKNLENMLKEKEKEIKEKEKKVKNLENILKEKEKQIKELAKKVKNLENILKEKENKLNNYQINKILELENEIKKLETYFLSPGEKLITVKFISVDQVINFSVTAKNNDKFSKLEDILYDKYPKYKDTKNYFLFKGKRINRNRTLEENKIKNNDVLTLNKIEEDE